MKEFTHSKFNFQESPNYSAHKTNEKFFKTISESPILGAGTPEKTSYNKKPSRNDKRNRNQSMFPDNATPKN